MLYCVGMNRHNLIIFAHDYSSYIWGESSTETFIICVWCFAGSLYKLDVACGKPARRRYCMGAKFSCISSLHAYSYIQQSGRNLQTMNAKNTKKSQIHENADANITCDFGDGDISRYRSRFTHTHGQYVTTISGETTMHSDIT